MARATDLVNLPDPVERLLEPAVFEDREHRRELLAGEAMRLPDLILLHDDELAIGRNLKAGDLRNRHRWPRDGANRAATLAIPHRPLQQLLLLGRCEMTALFLKLRQESVVDRLVDDEVAVGRAARAVV